MFEEHDWDEASSNRPDVIPAESVQMQEKVDTIPARQLSPLLRATAFMRVKGWSRPHGVMRATHAASRIDRLYSRT
jgi:hypothetical protein